MSDGRVERTDYQNSGIRNREKTHCAHGHEFTSENTGWQMKRDRQDERRSRYCKTCDKLRMEQKRLDPKVQAQERVRTAKWRERNPEKNRESWQRSHTEKKQILDDARVGGCIECGEKRLPCLDFHHRDGKDTKEGNIAEIRRFSPTRIRAEIAKCDVLCANCHRWHHHLERNNIAG